MAASPSASVRWWFISGIALTLALAAGSAGSASWRASASVGPDESTFVPVTPTRILDTRDPVNLGLDGPFVSPRPQNLTVTGSIPTADGDAVVVPEGATAISLNVTVVNPTAAGFVSVRPAGMPDTPTTSSLNFEAGQTTPNAVTVSLPSSGDLAGAIEITYDAYGQTGPIADMLIDVLGYTTTSGIDALVSALARKADTARVYTRDEIDARPADHVVAGGMVSSDGALEKGFGGVETARTATGRYTITLHGFECPSFDAGPTVQATLLNDHGDHAPGFVTAGYLATCTSNGATILLSTANVHGHPADRYFQFFIVTGGGGLHGRAAEPTARAHRPCDPVTSACTTD